MPNLSGPSTGGASILSGQQAAMSEAPPPPKPAFDALAARRQRLLEGRILPTIFRLSGPTVVGSLATISSSIIQLHFIGRLGVGALASVTLVFPCLSMMQYIASAGFGAGVASAIARSLGAGRRADAEALVLNAVVLAVAFGVTFAGLALYFGPTLYRLIGGTGPTLAASLAYSNWVFGAAPFVWLSAFLICALIGSGNTVVPQIMAIAGIIVVVPLSLTLIFGWGPIPAMGLAGGGLALACYNVAATAALIGYFRSSRASLRLRFDYRLIEWRLMRDILHVGFFAALGVAIPALSVTLITAAVARFGADAVAGYGIAIRADYLLLPLYFGICSGIVPMVGANFGAGQIRRARRIALTGAFIAGGIGCAAGLFLALAPSAWIGLFNKDPAVLASGSLYFRIVGIQFPLSAIAFVLGGAAQAAGRPLWLSAAVTARLTVAGGGSWLVVAGIGGRLDEVYVMLAIGAIFYCGVLAVGQFLGRTIPEPAKVASVA
jgi:MATE family, multidrug efflux pump